MPCAIPWSCQTLPVPDFRRAAPTPRSSPKWVPQLADAADVLARVRQQPGTRYTVLTPNMKAREQTDLPGCRNSHVCAHAPSRALAVCRTLYQATAAPPLAQRLLLVFAILMSCPSHLCHLLAYRDSRTRWRRARARWPSSQPPPRLSTARTSTAGQRRAIAARMAYPACLPWLSSPNTVVLWMLAYTCSAASWAFLRPWCHVWASSTAAEACLCPCPCLA